VLLAKSKNSSLQNKCFDHKRRHQQASSEDQGFYNGSYSEIQVASYQTWTQNEIMERGRKMLKFMESRWMFDISEWNDITPDKLLGFKTEILIEPVS